MPDIGDIVAGIAGKMRDAPDRGQVADYIAPLAQVDPRQFGIAVVMADGTVHVGGDADTPFSVQSISKNFTLTLALGRAGDQLWQHVGREPSGTAFNSIVQLESEHGIPRNPFINAGAMVVSDVILAGHRPREALGEIVRFVRSLAGEDGIHVDQAVARAEQATAWRNAALANYMRAFSNLHNAIDLTLGLYVHHCAIAMTCRHSRGRDAT